MAMIPVGTDQKLTSFPYATVSLILINTVIYVFLSRLC